MKKYITIAALLAAGTAFAEAKTIADIDTSDVNLKAYFNFETNNTNQVQGGISFNELAVRTQDDDGNWYGSSQASNKHPYTTAAGLKLTDGFTVSFDAKDVGNGTLLSMTTGNMGQAWRSISISYSSENKTLSTQFHGDTSTAVTEELSFNEWATITLVGSVLSKATNTICLDLYVDGAHIGQSQTKNASNATSDTFNNLQFGYFGDSSKGASMNVDNILVYNKALNASEVLALIPEPSAFGLLAGLGALALVGARRRRR